MFNLFLLQSSFLRYYLLIFYNSLCMTVDIKMAGPEKLIRSFQHIANDNFTSHSINHLVGQLVAHLCRSIIQAKSFSI